MSPSAREFDLVIVGAGGSGLAAAVSAAEHGLRVVVLEKQPHIGGTTGIAIGALSSAFGYGFGALIIILLAQLFFLRRKRLRGDGGGRRTARQNFAASAALVVAATIGSFAFSLESCNRELGCHRIFFERIYTPPHLVRPT